eukprot:CAMPEP_0184691730 /NCGR_PEP_ID=MMETSP0313-20130426/483_1 /TAXON_ID=2792 /ORGANISM="Porphyridium aerugineum, Strain SAG 1380-2" /LENGTH=525 /DNA_ID=CAMNT_0027149489 /DNA_START=106 /DNA_END=1683 /DNA_ORIENTATION=-
MTAYESHISQRYDAEARLTHPHSSFDAARDADSDDDDGEDGKDLVRALELPKELRERKDEAEDEGVVENVMSESEMEAERECSDEIAQMLLRQDSARPRQDDEVVTTTTFGTLHPKSLEYGMSSTGSNKRRKIHAQTQAHRRNEHERDGHETGKEEGSGAGYDKDEIAKYIYQQYRLFSKYDQGILLDRESWYSVTPEKIAKHVAMRFMRLCEIRGENDKRKEIQLQHSGESGTHLPESETKTWNHGTVVVNGHLVNRPQHQDALKFSMRKPGTSMLMASINNAQASGIPAEHHRETHAAQINHGGRSYRQEHYNRHINITNTIHHDHHDDDHHHNGTQDFEKSCGSKLVLLDAFCGAGGNSIQFALQGCLVIGIDIDPVKIALAKHNATIYGVADQIEFLTADCFELIPTLRSHTIDAVFASPPWSGPSYLYHEGPFHLDASMHITRVMRTLLSVSPNMALFLPRNSDLKELYQLTQLAKREMGHDYPFEVELNYLSGKLKAITLYTGHLLAQSPHQTTMGHIA